MIAKQDLINRHKNLVKYAKQKDSVYGSIPEPLFIDGKFNKSNWNGGDAVIRQFTTNTVFDYYGDNSYKREFELGEFGGDFVAVSEYFNDRAYFTIILNVYDGDSDWFHEQYLIVYYKNRGKTDGVYKDGELISFDEYVRLLNIIEATGYRFDLNAR